LFFYFLISHSLGTLVIVPEDVMKIIIEGLLTIIDSAEQLGFPKGKLKIIASINSAQQKYASIQNLSHVSQFKLLEWFPQNDLLGHPNVLMLIGHGGTNGISECIYHAKPILGIPFVSDQEDNMMKADIAGIGICLSKYSLTSALIYDSVYRILKTEKTAFKKNVEMISNICRRDGGAKAAVHWIEYSYYAGSKHLLTNLLPNSGVSSIAYYNIDVFFAMFVLAVILSIGLYFGVRFLCRRYCGCCRGNTKEKQQLKQSSEKSEKKHKRD
jgi:hypothetical protein